MHTMNTIRGGFVLLYLFARMSKFLLLLDLAQILSLLHYYYSPLFVYAFDVLDVSSIMEKLLADGKKRMMVQKV
jgi:hypothetical protein